MKKLIAVISLVAALAIPVRAQTTNVSTNSVISGPAADAWAFITTQGITNWFVVPFATYDTTAKDFGGGLALGYKLSDYVAPVMRFDYIHGGAYSAQADMQLQLPVTLFNKVTLVPFGFAGVATCFAGAGSGNGEAVGVLGAGGALKLSSKWDVVADYEVWSGGPFHSNNQIRFGVLFKF